MILVYVKFIYAAITATKTASDAYANAAVIAGIDLKAISSYVGKQINIELINDFIASPSVDLAGKILSDLKIVPH